MQGGTHCDSYDDDQGFREERIDVRTVESKKLMQEVTIELPEAKELINFGRPKEMKPRCLHMDDLAELPHYLSASDETQPKQTESRTRATIRKASLCDSVGNGEVTSNGATLTNGSNKRTYNGRGKTLFDFFEAESSFQPVFRRACDDRPRQDLIYDYTANNKVIELSGDYDPKLYHQLAPHLRQLEPSYSDELSFDSNFECGNLSRVYRDQSAPNNFYCLLLNDSNTHGYTQWFCFRVRNTLRSTYTFHLMNMIKNTSMYRNGMKVAVFSEAQWQRDQRGWFKGGDDITYTNTRIQRTTKQNENYYCLAFSYTFDEENDTIYFALNQPYSYSRLVNFTNRIEPSLRLNKMLLTRKTVGYSLGNNIISSLVIEEQGSDNRLKRVVVIMARQHPGQTVGSFIAEGFVQALSQPTPEAQYLIKQFRFVVLPMINPDGVIYGHSRCNLAGLDLNRQWGPDLLKELTPQTHCVKKYLQNLHKQQGVEIMIDLHGHSKKYDCFEFRMNSFFYACRRENRCAMRLLSLAMGKFSDSFDLYSCTYGLARDKINTVRSQLSNIGINAYTLQNSYFGKEKNGRKEHFSEVDLKSIGASLLRSLFVLYADREAVRIYSLNRQILLDELEANIDRIQGEENKNKSDSGSESDPDGDLLALEERQKTMKLRDPNKKSKLIKSIGAAVKKKRFMSLIYRNKMAKEEAEQEERQRKKKVKKENSPQPKPEVSPDPPPKLTSDKRRKIATRNSAILNKKYERPPRTQTESFKLSSSKEPRSRVRNTEHSGEHSRQNHRVLIPSRQLYEHPSRKRSLLKEPLRLTRTEQTEESLEKQISVKQIETQSKRQAEKFMTELDAIRIRLNREQLLRSCNLLNKDRSLDETQFMKIEPLYRSKREAPQPPLQIQPQSPYNLSRKVSRSKKKFKVTFVDGSATSKYRKFESFLSDTETQAQILSKNRAVNCGDQNSVFYHFPLL